MKAVLCDHCGKKASEDSSSTLVFRKKSYDLCASCGVRVDTFLSSKPKSGFGDKVKGVLDEISKVD